MSEPKIKGTTVTWRGSEYVLPPLTLEAYEELWPKIERLGQAAPLESMKIMAEVVLEALKENHPELTLSELKKKLDMQTLGEAFGIVLASSAKGKPAGEAMGP